MTSHETTASTASKGVARAKDESKTALSRSASESSKSAFASVLDGEDDFSAPGTGTTREKVRHGSECFAGPFAALVRGWNVLFCCQEPNRKSSH